MDLAGTLEAVRERDAPVTSTGWLLYFESESVTVDPDKLSARGNPSSAKGPNQEESVCVDRITDFGDKLVAGKHE